MNAASSTPYDSISAFVASTRASADEATLQGTADASSYKGTEPSPADYLAALELAVEAAEDTGLSIPDAMTAEYLEFTAAHYGAAASRDSHQPSAIIMSPACGVLGLLLSKGFHTDGHTNGHLTCIEPEVYHQQLAREAFAQAKLKSNSFRFLPSHPLDVVSRLTHDFYDIAIAECPLEDLAATASATLPTLRSGGMLILVDSLVDGLVNDTQRTDRDIVAAREADSAIRALPGAAVARLPLGAGMTVVTKLSPGN